MSTCSWQDKSIMEFISWQMYLSLLRMWWWSIGIHDRFNCWIILYMNVMRMKN